MITPLTDRNYQVDPATYLGRHGGGGGPKPPARKMFVVYRYKDDRVFGDRQDIFVTDNEVTAKQALIINPYWSYEEVEYRA